MNLRTENYTVSAIANNLGFDLCGFTDYKKLTVEAERLQQWLDEGKHAGMEYMERNLEKRINIRELFPDAISVISLGMHYNTPFQHTNASGEGKISRYAWGKDYHLIIWDKLKEFIQLLQSQYPGFEAISYVDTGPVMDKVWAQRAGIGWMGKHSNIINPEQGSWFFIATVICNAEFSSSVVIADHCGTCTRCIDACPTKAIVSDYTVDANRCISYLTIENKGAIPVELIPELDNWMFGCDVCQDVCPWNQKFAAPARVEGFNPRDGKTSLNLEEVLHMESTDFKQKFSDSPIKRAKLRGLQRNAEALQQKSTAK